MVYEQLHNLIYSLEKLVYALMLDAWLHIFGFSVTAIRSLSTFASIMGVGFWFLSLHLLYGQRIALWASALLSLSVFGIYFGRLSTEMYCVLFYVPLCLLIYAYWKRRPSSVIAACGGVVVGLALFTYPGFLLALVATIGGLTATLLWSFINHLSEKETLKPRRETVRGITAALVAFLVVTTIGLALHSMVYSPSGGPIFVGGGSLMLSPASVLTAIQKMLVDIFVEGSSWYLVFKASPFVEVVLLPFFITGILVSWSRKWDWKIRGVILSMPAVILLSAVTGAYPGMRRAIYFLLPFYFFSAVGISQFFSMVQQAYNRNVAVSKFVTPLSCAILLVVFALIHPIYYQLTYGRQIVSWNHGEGFGAKKISLDYISNILRSEDVILSRFELAKYFDHHIYEHYPKMEKRYGVLPEDARDVYFIEDMDARAIKALSNRDDWKLLTWTSMEIANLSKQISVCFDGKLFSQKGDLPLEVFRYSSEAEKNGAYCVKNGEFEGLDFKF